MQEYYGLTFVVISLVFLSPLVGYTASALLNNSIHLKFGQRGVAVIAPTCHLIAYIVIAVHPPYPVLVIIFMLAGFGNGLADAAWSEYSNLFFSAPIKEKVKNRKTEHFD